MEGSNGKTLGTLRELNKEPARTGGGEERLLLSRFVLL